MAKRTTMNISLPRALKSWIDKRVDEHGFASSSEFLRHLVRRDQASHGAGDIDAHLLAALDSGPPTPLARSHLRAIKERGRAQARANPRRRSA